MDVREKLAELLNEVQETGVNEIPAGFGYTRQYISNKKVADHLISHGVTVQQWIPVTKRFPNTGAVVLTFSNKDGVNIGKYVGYGAFVVRKWDINSKPSRTTHWIPLPEPPKEESEAEEWIE